MFYFFTLRFCSTSFSYIMGHYLFIYLIPFGSRRKVSVLFTKRTGLFRKCDVVEWVWALKSGRQGFVFGLTLLVFWQAVFQELYVNHEILTKTWRGTLEMRRPRPTEWLVLRVCDLIAFWLFMCLPGSLAQWPFVGRSYSCFPST